jgi:Holliday junction resolvasome RuvABC endonuclease subunit
MLRIAQRVVDTYMRAPQPCLVVVENFAFHAIGSQNDLGELHGIVKSQLWLRHRAEPLVLTAAHVRKRVFGRGKMEKAQILDAVRTVAGVLVGSHDEADAWALAACGLMDAGIVVPQVRQIMAYLPPVPVKVRRRSKKKVQVSDDTTQG